WRTSSVPPVAWRHVASQTARPVVPERWPRCNGGVLGPRLRPPGGAWRAWYARRWTLLEPYHDRQDDAGRGARRLLRELDALWVLLTPCGVAPTNNRAERAWRCGVLWRKRSHGMASTKGNHEGHTPHLPLCSIRL